MAKKRSLSRLRRGGIRWAEGMSVVNVDHLQVSRVKECGSMEEDRLRVAIAHGLYGIEKLMVRLSTILDDDVVADDAECIHDAADRYYGTGMRGRR